MKYINYLKEELPSDESDEKSNTFLDSIYEVLKGTKN